MTKRRAWDLIANMRLIVTCETVILSHCILALAFKLNYTNRVHKVTAEKWGVTTLLFSQALLTGVISPRDNEDIINLRSIPE